MDLSIYNLYPRSGKAACQKLDGSQIKPCLAAGDGPLKVPRQPPIAAKPGEGPLDHPASGQYLKTFGLVGSLDDLQHPLPAPGKRCLQLLPRVGAIGKDMAQPREEIADRGQQIGRTVSILDVGGVHLRANQMTAGIGNDVALATIDLLARIIAPRTSAFCGLDRLTVDHTCRRAGFAALPLPSMLDQQEVDLFPQPFPLPRIKITLHCRPLRKIARQQTPRTRRPQNVEQGVDNTPKRNYSRPSQGLLPRQVRRNQRPFRICHVTCIAQIFPPILPPRGFSPHLASPLPSDTAWVSQDAEIAQFISGQTLRKLSILECIVRRKTRCRFVLEPHPRSGNDCWLAQRYGVEST